MDAIEIALQKTQLNNTIKRAEGVKNKLESEGKQSTPEWRRSVSVGSVATEQLKNLSNIGSTSVESAATVAATVKNINIKDQLPIQPDPELIKKEAMAKAQTIRADAEVMLQQKKEEEINKLKEKVEQAAAPFSPLIGLFLKLPILDPKFIAWLTYQEAKLKIQELKQKASKENIKKSKEAFTFPMKKPTKLELGQLPKLETPKIPEIPKLPTIKLPNLPVG